MPLAHRWQVLVVALAIAVIGFLSIHNYNARAGLIWNIIHAQIHLTPTCEQPDSSKPWTLFRPEKPSLLRGDCGVRLPYRWVFAAALLLAALGVLWSPRGSAAPRAFAQDAVNYRSSHHGRLRLFQIIGWLALISAGCLILLGVATPMFEYAPDLFPVAPGYEHSWGRYIGEVLGAGLAIFLAASVGAGISAWIGRANPIAIGSSVAVAFTLLAWLGS